MPACVSLLSYNVYPSFFFVKNKPCQWPHWRFSESITYSSSYETPYHLFINKHSIPPCIFFILYYDLSAMSFFLSVISLQLSTMSFFALSLRPSLLWAYSYELWPFSFPPTSYLPTSYLFPFSPLCYQLSAYSYDLFPMIFQLTAMSFELFPMIFLLFFAFSLQLWATSFFLWSFCLSLCYQLTAMSHELFAISFQLWALSFFFPLPIHQSVELSG